LSQQAPVDDAQPMEQPLPKVEAPKTVQEPKAPTVQKVEQKALPTSIVEWKNQGSNISDLESIIESKYNTVASNDNGVLKASIDGVEYQWVIDDAGNPIKTKV